MNAKRRAPMENMGSVGKKRGAALLEIEPDCMKSTNSMMRAGLSLLQRDTLRLEEKLGHNLPHEEKQQTPMPPKAERIPALKIAQLLSKSKRPPVPEGGALVYGRITDNLQRGIAGLSIAIHDEKGGPIRLLEENETDTSGSYALTLDAKQVKALAALEEGHFTISTPAGNTVFRETRPIQLGSGERARLDLTLKKLIVMADGVDFQWTNNV